MKLNKKLNIKNLIILIIGSLSFIAFICDWVIAIVGSGTFTIFGSITNLLLAASAVLCFDYLENYLENKK